MKIADGLQYEVWAPRSTQQFPKEFIYVGFDRDAAIAAVDEVVAKGVKPEHLLIVVGEGFEVYGITVEDLRNKDA